MLVWLSVWSEMQIVCIMHMVQLMPLHPKTPSSLASFKSRLVLPFWYLLKQVVLEKIPLNGCSSSSSSIQDLQPTYNSAVTRVLSARGRSNKLPKLFFGGWARK